MCSEVHKIYWTHFWNTCKTCNESRFNRYKMKTIPSTQRWNKRQNKKWNEFPSWYFVPALLTSVRSTQKIIRSCEKSKIYRFRTWDSGSTLISRHRVFVCVSVIGWSWLLFLGTGADQWRGRFARVSAAQGLPEEPSRSEWNSPKGWTDDGNQWMGNVS